MNPAKGPHQVEMALQVFLSLHLGLASVHSSVYYYEITHITNIRSKIKSLDLYWMDNMRTKGSPEHIAIPCTSMRYNLG